MKVLSLCLALSGGATLPAVAPGQRLPAPAPATAPGTALVDSLRRGIEAAVVTGEAAPLRAARLAIDRAAKAAPEDTLLAYWRGYAAFREAGLLMAVGRTGEVGAVLIPAIVGLEEWADRTPSAEGLALLSTLYGQRIGASGSTLVTLRLGPSLLRAMDRAVQLAPQNPRVWLLRGISAYGMPAMVGGGPEKSEQYLRQAIALFVTDRAVAPAPTWGLADAWLWLGRALQARGNLGEARLAYAQAQELQPWNTWLTGTLIPSLGR